MQQKKEKLEKKQQEGNLINLMHAYVQVFSFFILQTLVCVWTIKQNINYQSNLHLYFPVSITCLIFFFFKDFWQSSLTLKQNRNCDESFCRVQEPLVYLAKV